MNVSDPVRQALLRLTVGDLAAEELPDLAADALTRGLDSPSLRMLAGARRGEYDENRRLFVAAMKELGVDAPPAGAAIRELVRFWASELVAGALTPYEGARRIWWQGWETLGRPDELTVFVGLASQWEDHPGQRTEYERHIVTAARKLLASCAT